MLASSFEKYIHRYGVVPEKNPVIFTNNSSTISLVKSLINLQHVNQSIYRLHKINEKDIEEDDKRFLKNSNRIQKKNIPFYPESEVEGCEGNKKVETS